MVADEAIIAIDRVRALSAKKPALMAAIDPVIPSIPGERVVDAVAPLVNGGKGDAPMSDPKEL